MSHKVFVYGTLKRGFPNHHYMKTSKLIGAYRTAERYPLVVGGRHFSPSLFPEPGTGKHVIGELWEVDDETLVKLDELETVHLPTGYRREMAKIEPVEGGATTQAWTYFRERSRVPVIHAEGLDDYQDRRYVAEPDRKG